MLLPKWDAYENEAFLYIAVSASSTVESYSPRFRWQGAAHGDGRPARLLRCDDHSEVPMLAVYVYPINEW